MRPTTCPRSFEAEAVRDGRLTGAALAAFGRHASGCAACAREVEALEALAGALCALPAGHLDELRVLRERTRLIAAFDATLVAPRRGWRRGLACVAGAAAVLAIAVGLWRPGTARPPAAAVAVRAGDDTRWSRRPGGRREIVTLTRGTLSIRVDHAAGQGRLLVELPDGELEDTGTTFTVSAASGRTTGVSVQEGSIVLRLRGQPSVSIGAGESWRSEAPSRPAAAVVVPTSEPPRPAVRHPARARAGAWAPPAADGSGEFRAAVIALNGGQACAAADAFARFEDQHQEDVRAEDAAYLAVIAVQRCGDDVRLKACAERYLRRYPQGFRRAEIERLSR